MEVGERLTMERPHYRIRCRICGYRAFASNIEELIDLITIHEDEEHETRSGVLA